MNNTVRRAEVTAIVNRMLGRSADENYVNNNQDTLVQFNDVISGHWAYYRIMEATNAHNYTMSGNKEIWTGLKQTCREKLDLFPAEESAGYPAGLFVCMEHSPLNSPGMNM